MTTHAPLTMKDVEEKIKNPEFWDELAREVKKMPGYSKLDEIINQAQCMSYAYDPESYCSEQAEEEIEKRVFKLLFDEDCTEKFLEKRCCSEKEICPVAGHLKFVYLGAPILVTLLVILVIFGLWRMKRKKVVGSGGSGMGRNTGMGPGTTRGTTARGTTFGATGAPTSRAPTSGAPYSGAPEPEY